MTLGIRSTLLAAVAATAIACSHTPAYEEVVTTDVVASVEFKVNRCALSTGVITCDLLITNRGEDARVVFTDADVAIFADGNQLTLWQMSFGGSPTVAVNTVARAGATQRLELKLTGATPETRSIRLIEIKTGILERPGAGGSEASRPVQLRNLRVF
jgi:hypothetical protein